MVGIIETVVRKLNAWGWLVGTAGGKWTVEWRKDGDSEVERIVGWGHWTERRQKKIRKERKAGNGERR